MKISPTILIISGLPCTGKTTLGREFASKLNLPFISKDDIKESLFDSLGYEDREWSKKLDIATYSILYYYIEAQLKAGRSFIVESNFHPQFDTQAFKKLQKNYSIKSILIQCECEGQVLFERFVMRSNSGERHIGHRDHLNVDEFKEKLLSGKLDLMDIDAKVFKINTTDLNNINLDDVHKYFEKEF